MPKQQRWSPMSCIPVGPDLSPSGLLRLDVEYGEVELICIDRMELRVRTDPLPIVQPPLNENDDDVDVDGRQKANISTPETTEWHDRDTNLLCTVTTHRIIFQQHANVDGNDNDEDDDHNDGGAHRPLPRFIHLSTVQKVESSGGSYLTRSSCKVELSTGETNYGKLAIVFPKDDGTSGIGLPLHQHRQRDDMVKALERSLARRAWDEAQKAEERRAAQQRTLVSGRRVGVDAILAKNRARHREAARVSDRAFSGDAERLLEEARDLVSIIHRYVATLQKREKQQKGVSSTSSSSNNDHAADDAGDDTATLTDMLQSMGMTSGLSKGRYGKRDQYYRRLAQQIADFLVPRLRDGGGSGMMTLTDVYCLFNRARAANFISPEDLLEVVPLLSEMKLGLSRRAFPDSGLVVIQHDDHDDQRMADRLLPLAEADFPQGLTPSKAGRQLGTSTLLATEHLRSAERMGVLCRDTTLEGTKFYPNYFLTKY